MASELHVDTIKHSGGTSALTIDSSGRVLNSNIPYFHVTGNHGWIDLGGGFNNYFNSNTSAVDVITNTGSHYVASTGRFTAPLTGLYQMSACFYVNDSGDVETNMRFYKNGSHWHDNYFRVHHDSTNYPDNTATMSFAVNLSATDYVQWYVNEDIYGHHSFWTGYLIG
tara:strand:+ start:368 stop:871 length:504 start_codon:yes stop_codon:yes gene_type:complete